MEPLCKTIILIKQISKLDKVFNLCVPKKKKKTSTNYNDTFYRAS